MEHIKSLLGRRIKQSGLARQVSTALIIEESQNIIIEKIGKFAGKKARVLYFKNNILNVACLSSVVAQEIKLKKTAIIDDLNHKIGQDIVKDIRLII